MQELMQTIRRRSPQGVAVVLFLCLALPLTAQLNQNCTVSVLNRTVPVKPDGSWVLPNIPANFGQVKARATCTQNGVTTFGESAFFTIPENGAVNLPAIPLGNTTPIPVSLSIAPATPSLTTAGQTVQLIITALYPDNSTRNVTAATTGTNYTISNPKIATISPAGLVTAVTSGTVVIQANNDGATAISTVSVLLGGANVGGIPVSWLTSHNLNPNDPLVAVEDPDRDGLTNLAEFTAGTDPNNPDTDADGLNDGDEVNKYHTSPLLADTDGDLIPDGVEITTGTNPLSAASYNLASATRTSTLTPGSFTLATSVLNPLVFAQLTWRITLIDGKTTLDLTADPRTHFSSNNSTVCTLSPTPGQIFAGNPGTCTITASQNNLTATSAGTITGFNPGPLSFLPIPGFANNVKVKGNYAYIAAGAAGLQVVDVTDRAHPRIVASLSLPSNANDLRIAGNTLFMAADSGLIDINITDPLHPAILGALSTPGIVWDVAVSGSKLLIAAGSAGLKIADVSNPATPTLLGGLPIPGGTAKGVDFSGNTAVIAASGAGVVTIDITNPASPSLLGSVATPGDARKVAVSGNAAFIADYPASMQVVDFSNPVLPRIVAVTADALGGKLQDVAVTQLAGFTYTLGADVYFVNGVPVVDVTTPANPIPRNIISFAGYRDDNGHGIGLDRSYVYMTGERGITDLGTTGDTALYIGQYQQIVDTGGIPPTVTITSPPAGQSLIQGQSITFSATATDDIAVASTTLLVNGQPVLTTSAPPYQVTYTIPANATTATFGATAIDFGNNIGSAADITLQVIPDPLTTVTGRIVDATNTPVSGVSVSALGRQTTSVADGTFTLTGISTIQGPITVVARGTLQSVVVGGQSLPLTPVRGGTISGGDIRITPIPNILSIAPKSALAGTSATLIITGTNFNAATFAFTASALTINQTTINGTGTQATLSVSIASTATGRYTVVGTNPAGSSVGTPTLGFITGSGPYNTLTVPGLTGTADPDGDGVTSADEITAGTDPLNLDTDGDGWPDGMELFLKSNPNDPASLPNPGLSTGYGASPVFSLLNTQNPGTGTAGMTRYVSSPVFSILNTLNPSTGVRGSTQYVSGFVFSIVNNLNPGIGTSGTKRYVSSPVFSLLNTLNPAVGVTGATRYVSSPVFSILNSRNPFTLNSGQTYYVSSPVFSIINTISPAPSGGYQRFLTGAIFSISNLVPGAHLTLPALSLMDTVAAGTFAERIAQPWLFGESVKNMSDSDGDGLSDADEIRLGTNPYRQDTDGDGYPDGLEVALGSNPLDPNSIPDINRPGFVISPAFSIQNYSLLARQLSPARPVEVRRNQ